MLSPWSPGVGADQRGLATGEIRRAERIVLATHNIHLRIGMNPELTEEEMRRALFGVDEPIAQDNALPVQNPLRRYRAISESGREKEGRESIYT